MTPPENSILDDVRAAAAEVNMPADTPIGIEPPVKETPAETAAGETAEQAAERARDEKGRFAKEADKPADKPRETLKLKPKEEAPKEPASDFAKLDLSKAKPVTDEQQQPKPADEPIAPPAEWKGAGKVQWNKLPKAIQAELRETYESVSADRQSVAPIRELLQSHRELLINEAGSEQAGLTALFTLARMSVDNPVGLIQHIARSRGIDLGAFGGGQQPNQGAANSQPDLNSLIEQAVQQRIAPIQQHFAQTETQQTEQAISAFQADPAHPYFNDVRVHMGQLLKAGAAKDLKDAYDQATWANPVIRQQLLQAQAEDTAKTQAAEAAAARKAAAASLTGAPIAGAGAPEGRASKTESARDTVLRAYREQIGA